MSLPRWIPGIERKNLSRTWRACSTTYIKEEATQTKLTGSTKDKTTAAKAVCDKAVADWVYVTMQSFQVTADSSFIEVLQTINKFAPPGYVPPYPKLIRGTLLTAAYEKSKEAAKEMFKDNEHNCALTIMSDGKTNNGEVPICNFIAKSAQGAHFLAAVDMSPKDKPNKKMADYIHEQCVETGVEKSFFLCVLDGALRSSFPFLEEKRCRGLLASGAHATSSLCSSRTASTLAVTRACLLCHCA
jgi:hypothetical protein